MRCILFLLTVMPFTVLCQSISIEGSIKYGKRPIEFANIYIESTLDGSSSDKNGFFSFTTEAKGEVILVISSLGYKTVEKKLLLQDEGIVLEIFLEEEENQLDEIVISAGTFEASEKKAGTIFKPIDIVSNAAAGADVFSALQTLPGVSNVGDQTGIFVRGGEATETRTFIDGAFVTNPFFNSVPEIPARGRFDPFLFQGTIFNTGGYSAEYGQALSSVILLNTQDLPKNDIFSFDLNIAGLGGSITRKLSERTSFSGKIGYTNLAALFDIVPQNREWVTFPNNVEGSFFLKHQNKNDGIFKTYIQYQNGRIGLELPNATDETGGSQLQNSNQNLFFNNSFDGFIGNNWKALFVGAISYDDEETTLENDIFGSKEFLAQSRITLKKDISSSFVLKAGGEFNVSEGTFSFNEESTTVKNALSAIYVESDFKKNRVISSRLGLRGEYNSILDAWNLAPRASISAKVGKSSSFSLAYGNFYQTPGPEVLREQIENLDYENSQHLILNYQFKSKDQALRIEGYIKDYSSLIRERTGEVFENTGFGYARGIDFFWKDEKSITNLTYWISYSYLDSKRFFEDYPVEATPTFVAEHTGNLIANYKIGNTIKLGTSYTYSSGRPYLNPNNSVFLGDRTPDFHNINFNGSLLTTLFGDLTIFYASLRNPLNFKQVFSYRYSDDGSSRTAVDPSSNWSFFVGMIINYN
ncbi:hypothetical protein HME9304_02184 [Flagellimonas maritima]|uniref:TonB-dependent receptor n=1 Tax=Flagellimonas maritima TaxID=1383885 RepID=A0A2Z4LUB9_9FLAO|nr:TonB-dependent receptor [Allomuricauda aurantiaca]AWX45174.1 hypothetical protein HME9304_02184 [Allomuricauda aurantiaca]